MVGIEWSWRRGDERCWKEPPMCGVSEPADYFVDEGSIARTSLVSRISRLLPSPPSSSSSFAPLALFSVPLSTFGLYDLRAQPLNLRANDIVKRSTRVAVVSSLSLALSLFYFFYLNRDRALLVPATERYARVGDRDETSRFFFARLKTNQQRTYRRGEIDPRASSRSLGDDSFAKSDEVVTAIAG